jgi:hypothetical protein
MSVVGKIFVFLVLILSLIRGALTVVLYTARTTWAAQVNELKQQLTVSRANTQQAMVEKTKAENDSKAYRDAFGGKDAAEISNSFKKLQDDAKDLNDKIADLQANEQKWMLREKEQLATVASVQADLKRRQAAEEQLKTTLDNQLKENRSLVDLNNTLRQDKTTAEIKANALLARNKELEEKLQDVARELARLKSPLAGGVAAAKLGTGKNPPQDNIEGLIRQVDASSGLVKITLGSDANLQKGHTLEVFRLSNVPDQSKYLGTIKIIDVSATEAVGQPMGHMAAPVQVGDRVASRILGAS